MFSSLKSSLLGRETDPAHAEHQRMLSEMLDGEAPAAEAHLGDAENATIDGEGGGHGDGKKTHVCRPDIDAHAVAE